MAQWTCFSALYCFWITFVEAFDKGARWAYTFHFTYSAARPLVVSRIRPAASDRAPQPGVLAAVSRTRLANLHPAAQPPGAVIAHKTLESRKAKSSQSSGHTWQTAAGLVSESRARKHGGRC